MENAIEYLLKRASEESIKAIAADRPEVSDAHNELAVRYSSKALLALVNADESTGVACPESNEGQANAA